MLGYFPGLSGELIFDVDFEGGHLFDGALEGEIIFLKDILLSEEVLFIIK